MKRSISVIIPTLDAEKELPDLLSALKNQNCLYDELIIIDSESNDGTIEICKKDETVRLIQIKRKDFDHGKTRDFALRESRGEFVVFLTQDALPANENFLGNLIAPLSDPNVAVSTGRQLPKSNATRMEKLVRTFNYPAESHVRSKDDLSRMGIKTFFSSDVCAAYNRNIYLSLDGFDYPVKTNEDMFYAAKAINAGYKIAYIADACVFHSHNLTLKEQYKRNYIQGYEIQKHKEALCNVPQTNEGVKLIKYVSKELLKQGHIFSFIQFGFDCCARLLGSQSGKRKFLRERT